MAERAILKPEICELFREYRESKRGVFLEEIVQPFGFVQGASTEEIDAIYSACVRRREELRAPTGVKRGRPRRKGRHVKPPFSQETRTEVSRFIEGGSQDSNEFERVFWRDEAQHGAFRTVMLSENVPANRPLLLEQILLFMQGADRRELAELRSAVVKRRHSVKRSKRGRPDVREDEGRKYRARKAAWMHIVERRHEREIADALQIPIIGPVRSKAGLIMKEGNIESVRLELKRLEDSLAAAIWHAIPPNYTRVSATGRELAPGVLDYKPLRHNIRFRTGLPFDSRPEECKSIVTELWPRGAFAYMQLIERKFSYQQRKQKQPAD